MKRSARTDGEAAPAKKQRGAAPEQPAVKKHHNGMLKVQLAKKDPRNAIVARNSTESPLLRLPAEVRNRILEFAVGHQHVHILTDRPRAPSVFNRLVHIPLTIDDADREACYLYGTNYMRIAEASRQKLYNQVYPLDWRSFYTAGEAEDKERLKIGDLLTQDQVPRQPIFQRLISPSHSQLTLIPSVCRQMYAETSMLLYTKNEFSFHDERTARDWFVNRTPHQKRALEVVWIDLEWICHRYMLFDFAFNIFGKESGIKRVVVSRLAVRKAAERISSEACDAELDWSEVKTTSELNRRLAKGFKIEYVD